MRNFLNTWSAFFIIIAIGIFVGLFYTATRTDVLSGTYRVLGDIGQPQNTSSTPAVDGTGTSLSALTPIDTAAYDAKLLAIANVPPRTISTIVTSTIPGTTTIATSKVTKTVPGISALPVKTVLPDAGALLPFNRIVAYYGNFYSTQMGVLGEYPPDEMMAMLASTTAEWRAADPSTPVIPALDYIAVTTQGSPGRTENIATACLRARSKKRSPSQTR